MSLTENSKCKLLFTGQSPSTTVFIQPLECTVKMADIALPIVPLCGCYVTIHGKTRHYYNNINMSCSCQGITFSPRYLIFIY